MRIEQENFINIKEVKKIIGFGTTYIYDHVKNGTFPAPHKIGSKASRWSLLEVNKWLENQKNKKHA